MRALTANIQSLLQYTSFFPSCVDSLGIEKNTTFGVMLRMMTYNSDIISCKEKLPDNKACQASSFQEFVPFCHQLFYYSCFKDFGSYCQA